MPDNLKIKCVCDADFNSSLRSKYTLRDCIDVYEHSQKLLGCLTKPRYLSPVGVDFLLDEFAALREEARELESGAIH